MHTSRRLVLGTLHVNDLRVFALPLQPEALVRDEVRHKFAYIAARCDAGVEKPVLERLMQCEWPLVAVEKIVGPDAAKFDVLAAHHVLVQVVRGLHVIIHGR